MKDALGHGSDGKGAHAQGTTALPKMQRRHFEAIAAELKARGAGADEIHHMADRLSTTNPGFRRDYFVAAATGGIIPKGTVTTVTGKTSARDAAYRDKGPGANAGAVGRTAAKALGDFNSPANHEARVNAVMSIQRKRR